MIDSFFYYSGLVAWICLGLWTIFITFDHAIDWIVKLFWTKKEFLAFVADRLAKQRGRHADQI
jgi:hypothetical protein